MHEKIVYLNGSFVPESEAKVSVLDMGFHAGDGVYDVTRTFRHKPFKLKEHNDRLFRSLKYTRIDCGMSQDEMEAAALEVIERNKDLLGPDDDYAVWQVISRGARSSKGPRTNTNATVAIYCMDVDFTGFCRHYVEGVTIVVPATRRIPPQCLESKAKITNKMNHIIATFEARQADPKAIPLMLDLDGNIAESNAHNFFAVVGGKVYTPGSKNVLGGITRAVLGELSDRLDLEVEETNLTPYDCLNADEAFLTSTSPTIVPIKSINGVGFPYDVPGPVTLRLLKGWAELVGVDIVAQAIGHMEGEEKDELMAAWNEKQAALGL